MEDEEGNPKWLQPISDEQEETEEEKNNIYARLEEVKEKGKDREKDADKGPGKGADKGKGGKGKRR